MKWYHYLLTLTSILHLVFQQMSLWFLSKENNYFWYWSQKEFSGSLVNNFHFYFTNNFVCTLKGFYNKLNRPLVPWCLTFFQKHDITHFYIWFLIKPLFAILQCWKIVPSPSFPKGISETLHLFPLFCMKITCVKISLRCLNCILFLCQQQCWSEYFRCVWVCSHWY